MRRRASASLLVLATLTLCLLAACGDDAYHYPSVRLEFLTAWTGSDGALHTVQTDNGRQLPVATDDSHTEAQPDTLLRIVANYESATLADGSPAVRLWSVTRAVAPRPQPREYFAGLSGTDPADVLSIWPGGGFLNMVLEVKAQHDSHSFHFVEESVEHDADHTRTTVSLLLFHETDDTPAYTQRAYLSVPLTHYVDNQTQSLRVNFSLHTQEEGLQTYSFDIDPSTFPQNLLQ